MAATAAPDSYSSSRFCAASSRFCVSAIAPAIVFSSARSSAVSGSPLRADSRRSSAASVKSSFIICCIARPSRPQSRPAVTVTLSIAKMDSFTASSSACAFARATSDSSGFASFRSRFSRWVRSRVDSFSSTSRSMLVNDGLPVCTRAMISSGRSGFLDRASCAMSLAVRSGRGASRSIGFSLRRSRSPSTNAFFVPVTRGEGEDNCADGCAAAGGLGGLDAGGATAGAGLGAAGTGSSEATGASFPASAT